MNVEMYSNVSDFNLIDIILTKDTEAFGELYLRYSSKIYNKCIQIIRSKEDAEDLTHDIFLKIFISLKSFKKKSKFSTWIYTITYNECMDYLRKESKLLFWHDIDIQEIEEISDNISDNTLFQINAKTLIEILTQIRVEDKIVLLMKYQDEMTIRQISRILQISESATKMRIKRAKETVVNLYIFKYKHEKN